MALTTADQIQAERDQAAQLKISEITQERDALQFQLMIASLSDRASPYQDKTTYREDTPGEKLEKSGEYLKDPEKEIDTSVPLESRMFDIDPKRHKTQQKQKKIRNIAEEGATEGEREAGRGKLQDKTQLPDFLQNINIKPQDLLKILQLIPALTGGFGLQKAGVDYGVPSELDKYWQRTGYPSRNESDEERLRKVRGSIPFA
tara:strand:+ start:40 stop:648 length:609 start_codon:yes stop_codon:yes gene_type:complete